MRKTLHSFRSKDKDCENKSRFTFITGISEFKRLSIFSGMNDIKYISLDAVYSTICGFSEDDII
ncbi:MAG: AAA family ATPase [Deltaproteobacteria bacterium]|nr:AAA family ATPase [Deltaproteobacteria bacterium]